ncbi:RHS repeat-associated core domain-containing protein [Fulvivirga sp.]|uniref:leucine-rich repeat domain-containing protein n=1 Tax=Fulvivirga sp. TaxID=1931237 RepID=UPI0032F021D2
MIRKGIYLFILFILGNLNTVYSQSKPCETPPLFPVEKAFIASKAILIDGSQTFYVGETYPFWLLVPINDSEVIEVAHYQWRIDGLAIQKNNGERNILITIPPLSSGEHLLSVVLFNECKKTNPNYEPIERVINISTICEEEVALARVGSGTICPNAGSYDFVLDNATETYNWEVSNGATFNVNTNTISVTFPAPGDYTITSTKSDHSECTYSLSVSVEAPVTDIASVSGLTNTCVGNVETYIIEGSENATYFDWGTAPAGLSYAFNDAAQRSVDITFNAAGSYPISISPQNDCGNGTAFSLTLFGEDSQSRVDEIVFGNTELTAGSPMLLAFNTCAERSSDCRSELVSFDLKVGFDLGIDYDFGQYEFSGTVDLSIEGIGSTDPENSLFTEQRTLKITKDKPETLIVLTPDIDFSDIRTVSIEVSNYSIVGGVENVVRLWAKVEDELLNSIEEVVLSGQQATPLSADSWDVDFTWSSSCNLVDGYQLRVLKVFEGESVPESASKRWDNALLFNSENSDTDVVLTLAEGSGQYAWQVRPVGSAVGGFNNNNNFNDWPPAVQTFNYVQPDEDKNFIYSRTFTEKNKISEQLTFADGLQRIKQQQTRLKSTSTVVGTQTLQDFSGRDVLQSLPVPIKGKGGLGYEGNLLTDGTDSYSPENFDEDTNLDNPTPAYLDKTGSDSGYYGNADNGINQNVADANGVPFTRTIYTNDGTGRIKKQSGVGAEHGIGGEHTIRYYYAGVAQDELDFMFGNQAPVADNTTKSIIVDANNTASINYQAKDGKTLATALVIGTGNENLDGLGTRDEATKTVTESITEKAPFGTNSSSSRKDFVFTVPTELSVNYTLSPATIADICSSICKTCDYQVTFILHDLEDPSKTSTLTEYTIAPTSVDCGAAVPYTKEFFLDIEAGNYSLEKRVSTGNRSSDTGNLFIDDHLAAVADDYRAELAAIFGPIDTYIRNGQTDLDALYAHLSSEGYQLDANEENYLIPLSCDGEIIKLPYLVDTCNEIIDCTTPEGQDFVGYFIDYWRNDIVKRPRPINSPPLRLPLDDIDPDDTFDWLAYKYSPVHEPINFTVGEFNGMMLNLLQETGGTGTTLYDCQIVWDVWKQQVQNYEYLSNMTTDNGDVEIPEDFPDQAYEYNLIDNFFRTLDLKLKEIDLLAQGEDPDITTAIGLRKTGFYTSIPTTAQLSEAYKLFYYNASDEQMNNCMEGSLDFYDSEQGNASIDGNEAARYAALPQLEKQQIYSCIKFGDYNSDGDETLDDEVLLPLVGLCEETCESKRDAFRQAVINDIHGQELYVEGDARALEQDPFTGIYLSIGAPRDPAVFDFDLCQIEAMTEALVENCKGYCQIEFITDDNGNKVGIGTAENIANIQKVMTSTFEVNVKQNGGGSCPDEDGWDFLDYTSFPVEEGIEVIPMQRQSASFASNSYKNNEFNELELQYLEQLRIEDSIRYAEEYNAYIKERESTLKNNFAQRSATGAPSSFNMVPDDLEYMALRAIFESAGGINWYTMEGWDYPNWKDPTTVTYQDFTGWAGVRVANGDVVGLFRSAPIRISGTVPEELSLLSELVELHLWAANGETVLIPSEIAFLSKLEELKLSGMTGILPDLTNMSNSLEQLEIWNCDLTNSTIPTWLDDSFVNLTDLSFINSFQSSIPKELGEIPNILSIYIYEPEVSGAIPPELLNHLALETLIMSGCDFNSPLPIITIDNSPLEFLQIANSKITGNIPQSFNKLTSLETLNLASNLIEGNIPDIFSGMTELLRLNLSENRLEGDLPSSLGSLTKLTSLTLNSIYNGDYQFTSFPSSLTNLENLETLEMNYNNFQQELPANLGEMISLKHIAFYQSGLIGNLPESLGELIDLEFIVLSSGNEEVFNANHLNGDFPTTLSGLTKLKRLLLRNNNLTGYIPEEIFSFENLDYLYVSGNELSGYIPNQFSNGISIDLNYNNYNFGELENLFDQSGTKLVNVAYGAQKTILGTPQEFTFTLGQSFTLPFTTPGINNRYQWEKFDGEIWNPVGLVSSSSDLVLASTTEDDAGIYRCKVTNTVVTGLTLYSHEQTLVAEVNNTCFTASLCFRFDEPAQEIEVPIGLEDYVYTGIPYTCEELSANSIISAIDYQKAEYVNKYTTAFEAAYETNCSPTAVNDDFTLTYNLGYHHYTLYYYDRAGNLMRTVPPVGFNTSNADDHQMVTKYHYNSLGQLVSQESPDGGETQFYYNTIGQLRYSQNAKQKADGTYSYTKYDPLGRIVEVGQSNENTNTIGVTKVINDPALPEVGAQITRTVYTTPFEGIIESGRAQEPYLRNRVSYSYLDEDGSDATTTDRTYTIYNYDPHGNVSWLVQDVPGLGQKTIEYAYDLLSGNVLQVSYNPGEVDEYYHRYDYDADNRIVKVETSKDGFLWDTDASYEYYAHGPLKSAVIGEDKVQQLDYIYTIHGWLKAINNTADGENQSNVGADAFAMALNYYSGDYSSATGSYGLLAAAPQRDLYNGNISAWEVATKASDESWMRTGFQYQYDELNRIKDSRFNVYRKDDGGNETFYDRGGFGAQFTLDANGNLETLSRNDIDAVNFDALTYHLQSGNNRLDFVDDDITDESIHNKDIEDQDNANYTYDEIGNLTRDEQEAMAIDWTVYGKVDAINKDNGAGTKFIYDAAGNRVAKKTLDEFGNQYNTFYVRDASGNIMATYRGSAIEGAVEDPKLIEMPIYGSDRLGVYTPEGATENNQDGKATIDADQAVDAYEGVNYELEQGVVLTLQPDFSFEQGVDGDFFEIAAASGPEDAAAANVYTRVLDRKQYELKDHLGNVRAVVTDRKLSTIDGSTPSDFKPNIVSASAYYPYGMDLPTVRWEPDTVLATMEPGNILNEIDQFDNYADQTIINDVNYNHTDAVDASYSFVLNGVDYGETFEDGGLSIPGSGIIGLAKSYKVQAGDKVSAEVYGKYFVPENNNATDIAASLTDAFIDAFTIPGGTEGQAITDFVSDVLAQGLVLAKTDDPNSPELMAGINFLHFDNNYNFVDGGFKLLSPTAENNFEQLQTEYIASEDGYIFVYTSNESDLVRDVYFDDMMVIHEKLVPDAPYNPDLVAYRYGFNGKEKDQTGEWGLNAYDYGFRIYNPALGRFLSVDPLAASYPWYTPYQFAGNTPIQAIDLDGLEEYKIHSKWLSDLFYSTKRTMDNYDVSFETQKSVLTAMLKRWENRKPENPEALRQYGYVDKLVTVSDPNAFFSVKGPLTGQDNLLLVDEELVLRVADIGRRIEESKERTISHLKNMHKILVEQDKVERQAKTSIAVVTIVASGGSFVIGAAGASALSLTVSFIADGSTIIFSADDIVAINSSDSKGFLESRFTKEQIEAAKFIGGILDLRTKKDMLNPRFKFNDKIPEIQKAIEALDAVFDLQTVNDTKDSLPEKEKMK